VNRSHVGLLACPGCAGSLSIRTADDGHSEPVVEGALECNGCSMVYPIRGGVPRFVPPENYAAGFGFQWNRHAKTQYDSFNGTRISEARFFSQTRWPREMTGETVLEVGSGGGRFTEQIASTGATVVSLEYSAAVEANHASNGHLPNVLIVQADLYRMPFPAASFDRVVCIGVLQHTPDVKRSFLALPRYLRPGGHLAIDVYRRPRGIRRLFNTRYWVRPLTRGVAPDRLYRLTSGYVRAMWPLARQIGRIPVVGRKLNWMLLIGSYHGMYDLTDDQMREWAVLDTFDMLAPAYDQPQDLETVRNWFDEAGLVEVEVHLGYNGIEGRGRRKPAIAAVT
jgi:SAM-dependent methyltransferase